MFCRDLHLTLRVSGLLQKIWLKESEVCGNFVSNKIIVTLVTQGCRLLSSPVLWRNEKVEVGAMIKYINPVSFIRR